MKKSILFIAIILFLSGPFLHAGTGESFRIEGMVHYFQPTDEFFKDIYGSGMVFGGEIGIKLWEWVSLWAAADFYNKEGKTTFTEEVTELRIIPVSGGLMFQTMSSVFRPYTAIGVGYFQYSEENPIGKVKNGDIGYIVQLGCRIKVAGPLFFDVKGSYSYCKVKPADFEIDLGGLKGAIGLGLEF